MTDEVFLERIDGVPIHGNEQLTFELQRWLTTLVDTLNSTIEEIQGYVQFGLTAPSYTTAQITDLAVNAPNGSMWYDIDSDNLKAKINGIVTIIV